MADKERVRKALRPADITITGWKDNLFRIKDKLAEDNLTIVAAGVAFYVLLAIFPAIGALVATYQTQHIHTWPTQVNHKLLLKGDAVMTHQKMLVYVLSLCFLFFLLPGCDSSGPAEEAGEKIDKTVQKQKGQFEEAKKEIAKAKAEIENLKNELTQARQERDEAKVRLEEAEQERQRILKEMEPSITIESQEKTTLEPQQNGNEPQGQEEMQPQPVN